MLGKDENKQNRGRDCPNLKNMFGLGKYLNVLLNIEFTETKKGSALIFMLNTTGIAGLSLKNLGISAHQEAQTDESSIIFVKPK